MEARFLPGGRWELALLDLGVSSNLSGRAEEAAIFDLGSSSASSTCSAAQLMLICTSLFIASYGQFVAYANTHGEGKLKRPQHSRN